MARRPRQGRISPIDQAILNAAADIAAVRAEFGDVVASAVTNMIGLEKDIEIKGPFASYMEHVRESAVDAISRFAEVDETDVKAIRAAQAAIRQYKTVLEWVATTFEIGTGEKAHMEAGAGSELKDD